MQQRRIITPVLYESLRMKILNRSKLRFLITFHIIEYHKDFCVRIIAVSLHGLPVKLQFRFKLLCVRMISREEKLERVGYGAC